MYQNRRIAALIPARGGSKGLKRKNVLPLNQKPLIGWTIEQAQKSKYLDYFLVSTDDDEIARISREFGALVPFMRPDYLASDSATSVDVALHAIEYLQEYNKQVFDYLLLLEPTSPLREDDDIDKMIEKMILHEEECDGLVSLGPVHEHPDLMKVIDGEKVLPYKDGSFEARRQVLKQVYFPYGVGYMVKVLTLREKRTFYPERIVPYVIKRYQCFEIDDIYDLISIEPIITYQRGM